MQCDQLADLLAGASDRSSVIDRKAQHHIDHCLRCQAELAQYRKLLRALQTLRTELAVPVPGLLEDILAAVGDAGERHAIRAMLANRRAAYTAAVAAATAGAATAAVLAARARRTRLSLAS